MSDIKDGGPAFPSMYADGEPDGMSLRDYFAIHADMRELIESDGFIPQRIAVNVMGSNPPNLDNDFMGCTQWWLEAEARIRYMKADAMLRVRGQS